MKRFQAVSGHNRTSSGTRVSRREGEAKFHLGCSSAGSQNSHATYLGQVVWPVYTYSRVTLVVSWESGLIVFHRFASESTALREREARREGERERERDAAVLPLGIQMRLRSARLSHPEIQTYLLRATASPIIMRREFNLSGPVVNTLRLDSRRVRSRTHRSGVEKESQVRILANVCQLSNPQTYQNRCRRKFLCP